MIEFLIQLFKTNPMFTGMATAGALAFASYQLRAIPGHLWKLFTSLFVITLVVPSVEERTFRLLSYWLAKHPDGKRSRKTQLTIAYDNTQDREHVVVSPGAGWHRIKEDGRTYLVRRTVNEPAPGGGGGALGGGHALVRSETLTFYALGRNPAIFAELVERATTVFEDKTSLTIRTASSSGGYYSGGRRTKRPLDSIDVPVAQRDRIKARIDEFMAARDEYRAKSVPWRFGLLLEGPPGTGKTSLIVALASLYEKPIHIINPAIFESDADFQSALNHAGNGFVVIEDIDSCKAVLKREISNEGVLTVEDQKKAGKGLTLSGVLNAIDGIASHEGRVLVVTSNCADAMDPAMLRPGRIDMRETLDLIAEPEVMSMFRRLRPGEDEASFAPHAKNWVGQSPAWVQNALLSGDHPANDQAVASAA